MWKKHYSSPRSKIPLRALVSRYICPSNRVKILNFHFRKISIINAQADFAVVLCQHNNMWCFFGLDEFRSALCRHWFLHLAVKFSQLVASWYGTSEERPGNPFQLDLLHGFRMAEDPASHVLKPCKQFHESYSICKTSAFTAVFCPSNLLHRYISALCWSMFVLVHTSISYKQS